MDEDAIVASAESGTADADLSTTESAHSRSLRALSGCSASSSAAIWYAQSRNVRAACPNMSRSVCESAWSPDPR